MSRVDRMVIEIKGPADLPKLDGMPASLSLGAMVFARLPRGRLDVTLPDGRTLRFIGKEAGPQAEMIVHDPTFIRTVAARGDIGFAFEPGNVRVAANGSSCRTGRVEQYRVERAALPFQRIGHDGAGLQLQPGQVLAQTIEPCRRAIDRGDICAGER